MRTVVKDFSANLRKLILSHGFTIVAGLTIALCIGLNTAIVKAARDRSSHSTVWEAARITGRNSALPVNYPDWKGRNHVFGDLAEVVDIMTVNLTGTGEPEKVLAGAVSTNFFQMIDVQPMIGRAFRPGEDKRGQNHVVILSHRLWSRRFGCDAGLVGKRVVLNGESYRVIGILPPDFSWNNRKTDIWVPYLIDPNRDYRAASSPYLAAAVRPEPGVTVKYE